MGMPSHQPGIFLRKRSATYIQVLVTRIRRDGPSGEEAGWLPMFPCFLLKQSEGLGMERRVGECAGQGLESRAEGG